MDYTSDLAWTSTNGRTTLSIGDRIYVNGEGDYRGKICYLGEVHFAKGEFAGVSLDHPLGNHNGSYRGRKYFQCEDGHGVFARVGKISKLALIPATNESSRCGLWRSSTSRESSPITHRVSFVKESSPLYSTYSSSAGSTRSFSKSPSPTPSSSSSNTLFGYGRYDSSTRSGYQSGLKIGDRVIVASSVGETKTGILRYLGRVEFASGEYAGIELFHPVGKNDGTIRGRHYFTCRHPYGLFVPSYKVESSPANKLGGSRQLGTRDNIHRILQYSSVGGGRGIRAGSYDEDFY